MKTIDQFRKILLKNKHAVSEIEYTKGNYDNDGKEIRDSLPTVTTNYCEIGSHHNDIYFVFILESSSFNQELFDAIKDESNVHIYGFTNCLTDLYPKHDFDYEEFISEIKKDCFTQIQFDFKNPKVETLYREYLGLINVFEEKKVKVVDQTLTKPAN